MLLSYSLTLYIKQCSRKRNSKSYCSLLYRIKSLLRTVRRHWLNENSWDGCQQNGKESFRIRLRIFERRKSQNWSSAFYLQMFYTFNWCSETCNNIHPNEKTTAFRRVQASFWLSSKQGVRIWDAHSVMKVSCVLLNPCAEIIICMC